MSVFPSLIFSAGDYDVRWTKKNACVLFCVWHKLSAHYPLHGRISSMSCFLENKSSFVTERLITTSQSSHVKPEKERGKKDIQVFIIINSKRTHLKEKPVSSASTTFVPACFLSEEPQQHFSDNTVVCGRCGGLSHLWVTKWPMNATW